MNEQKQDCYRAKRKDIWWKQSKCFWLIAKQQEDDYTLVIIFYHIRIIEKKTCDFSSLAKNFKNYT